MVTPPHETTADPYAVIAALRGERDALAEALAQRNSEYSERVEYQTATIDVLRAMSVSPGDAQPVFDLIAQRIRAVCGEGHSAVAEFDGEQLHLRANSGNSDEIARLFEASFPQPLSPKLVLGRPIQRRWKSRRRPPKCCRSSTPRRAISRPCSMRCWRRR